jgi:hypothetical protein
MLRCHRICSHFPVMKWTAKKMVFVCMLSHLSCRMSMCKFEMKTQTHQDYSGYAKNSAYKPDQLQDRVTIDDNRRRQCSIINRNDDKRIQHPFRSVKVHLSVVNKAATLNTIPEGSVSTTILQKITKHACDIHVCDGCERESDIH